MDYKVATDNNGLLVQTWEKSDDITTAILLTLNTKKNIIFASIGFGLDLSDIKKITVDTIPLITQRIESALQFLLDIKKAESITVLVQENTQNIGQVNAQITYVEAEGLPKTLAVFIPVGGP